MDKTQTFQQFLTTQSAHIPVPEFLLNMVLTTLLAYLLGRLYIRFGSALSNRRMFANNFLLLAVTTMLIITIVKSSLALSLGLVGALSIVRFRAAIKEPEELIYLFLAIALGLGFGADQKIITTTAFFFICGLIVLGKYLKPAGQSQHLFLTVSNPSPKTVSLSAIITALKKHALMLDISRLDEREDITEVSFQIDFESFDQLEAATGALRQLNKSIEISLMDNKGIL